MNPASAIFLVIGEVCGQAVNMARCFLYVSMLDGGEDVGKDSACGEACRFFDGACECFGGGAIVS